MDISLVYCPFPSYSAAEESCTVLLSKKLIACGNIISSKSNYLWEGSITSEDEWILVGKTLPSNLESAIHFLTDSHPYQTPLIGNWDIKVNRVYYDWIISVLS